MLRIYKKSPFTHMNAKGKSWETPAPPHTWTAQSITLSTALGTTTLVMATCVYKNSYYK